MLEGRLKIQRSPRAAIGRSGTLRDDGAGPPIDIAIEDLSETGCLIYAPIALSVGTRISLGIAGLKRRVAVVRRVDGQMLGCAFVKPISAADVARARSHETVISLRLSAAPLPPEISLLDPQSLAEPALIDEVQGVASVWEAQMLVYRPRARSGMKIALSIAAIVAVAAAFLLLVILR